MAFAKMGGYVDFTSGQDTMASAKRLQQGLEEIPLPQLTLSSDSNGSLPKWNDRREIIGMGVGSMSTLFATIRDLYLSGGASFVDAIRLITENVAKALEIYPAKGVIAEGSDADLVLLSADEIDGVIAKGRIMMENRNILVPNYYN